MIISHTAFFSAMKAGKAAPCYLFTGEEEHTKRAALAMIRKKVLTGPLPDMNEGKLCDPSADAIIAANETLPVGQDMRLNIIYDSKLLTAEKPKDYDEDDSLDKLRDYLKDPPGTACLVFYMHGAADKRRKFWKVIEKAATIVEFNQLKDAELQKWIRQEFGKNGKTIDTDVLSQLIFAVGKDLTQLGGEIAKLSSYVGENSAVTAKDIDAVCSKTVEYKVYDMTDALFSGDGRRAFVLLKEMLQDGEERLALLPLVGAQCRRMLGAVRLAKERVPASDIAKRTGINPYFIDKTMTQARAFTIQQLEDLSRECVTAEYLVKSGRMPEEGSLEQVMLHILKCKEDPS